MQIGNNMIIPADANSEKVEFFILKMQLKKAHLQWNVVKWLVGDNVWNIAET